MKMAIFLEKYFGLNERIKSRGFQATQFNVKSNAGNTNTIVDPNNLDLFYNQANFSNDNLEYIYFSRKLSSI
jgi:hypothetical protein